MKKLCLFLLLVVPMASFGTQHEIFGGTVGRLVFGSGTSIGGKVGYNYTVMSPIQFGVQTAVAYSKADGAASGSTALVALAGPTFNFPFDMRLADAFFLEGMAGISHASISGTSLTKFTFSARLGKRFEIVEHVSFRPNAGISKVTDNDMLFEIVPIQFTFLF